MVELIEKAMEAAANKLAGMCHGYSSDEPFHTMTRMVVAAYLSALPAPDDGLAERLKAGSIALKNDRPASSSIMEEAATGLQSKEAELQHLRADAANPDKGMWTFWNEKARELSEQIERLTNRAEVAEYKRDQAVNVIQPMIISRAEAAEQKVQKITAENERLREALGATDYLIDRLRNAWCGKSVRDMDEAEVAYIAARSALETQEGGN